MCTSSTIAGFAAAASSSSLGRFAAMGDFWHIHNMGKSKGSARRAAKRRRKEEEEEADTAPIEVELDDVDEATGYGACGARLRPHRPAANTAPTELYLHALEEQAEANSESGDAIVRKILETAVERFEVRRSMAGGERGGRASVLTAAASSLSARAGRGAATTPAPSAACCAARWLIISRASTGAAWLAVYGSCLSATGLAVESGALLARAEEVLREAEAAVGAAGGAAAAARHDDGDDDETPRPPAIGAMRRRSRTPAGLTPAAGLGEVQSRLAQLSVEQARVAVSSGELQDEALEARVRELLTSGCERHEAVVAGLVGSADEAAARRLDFARLLRSFAQSIEEDPALQSAPLELAVAQARKIGGSSPAAALELGAALVALGRCAETEEAELPLLDEGISALRSKARDGGDLPFPQSSRRPMTRHLLRHRRIGAATAHRWGADPPLLDGRQGRRHRSRRDGRGGARRVQAGAGTRAQQRCARKMGPDDGRDRWRRGRWRRCRCVAACHILLAARRLPSMEPKDLPLVPLVNACRNWQSTWAEQCDRLCCHTHRSIRLPTACRAPLSPDSGPAAPARTLRATPAASASCAPRAPPP